ncbi:hypothetical protein [Vulcanococcus limneticus]|uniref:hypothetical protein n=1 Tax=Vulcanococcus limneticus TaxID=2170428 RepID=UPI00398BE3B6
MKEDQNPEAEVVADLVGLGARLEAQSDVLNDPSFDTWYVDGGWRWLAFLTPRRIPLMGVYLLRRAARIRPAWVDPAAVDLADPLATELLELAETFSRGIEAE